METTLTYNDFETKLREIAAANPDFVYTRNEMDRFPCSYTPDARNPHGCIIGATIRAFKPTASFIGIEGLDPFKAVQNTLNLTITIDQALLLKEVQNRQDKGASWGEAIKALDE